MNVYKEYWTDHRILFLSSIGFAYGLCAIISGFWNVSWWTLAALAGGVVFFYVLEYILHRFLLHGFGKYMMPDAYRGHKQHHDEPETMKYLLTPNTYNVPYHLLLWVVFYFVLGLHLGSTLMLTFCMAQLYYEWVHFVSHRPIAPKTKWGQHMKKHHLLHHYKSPERWYGVTNDSIDRMMGTGGKPNADKAKTTSM